MWKVDHKRFQGQDNFQVTKHTLGLFQSGNQLIDQTAPYDNMFYPTLLPQE